MVAMGSSIWLLRSIMWSTREDLLPGMSHDFINWSNTSNILRYLYGRTQM